MGLIGPGAERTRIVRRLHPDSIPLETRTRILGAAIRALNGGNTQRRHFLAVDDPATNAELPAIYRSSLRAAHGRLLSGLG